MIKKNFLKLIQLYIAIIVSCLPFNFIIGSKFSWFSYSSMAIPALGYHSSLLYVILLILTKSLLSIHGFVFAMIHRLPLFFSTVALQERHWKTSLLLPLMSIILFCIHPIGLTVWYYALYWFIPILIFIYIKDNVYSRALSASFIAHAVGSVIWLYTGKVPGDVWTLLMPIVPVERCIIACGMLMFIYIFQSIEAYSYNKAQV